MANSALYTGNDFQIGHHSVLSYQRDRRYLLRIISRRLISAHHEICGSLQLAIHLLFGETALATFVATHIRIEKELQVKTYCLRWTAIVSCAVVVLFCANLSYAGSAADLGKDLDAARMYKLLRPHQAQLERWPLYISLDKDVMVSANAAVNWDSGHLHLRLQPAFRSNVHLQMPAAFQRRV